MRGDDQGALEGQCQSNAAQEHPRNRRVFRPVDRAEIDDIARFHSSAKLAAYAGLVPSTYASGGKTWHGRITKQGNKWLRWAFVEAVTPAVASDPDLKLYYERLKTSKGANRAKVATARRLLTIAFQLLRDGRSYERRGTRLEGAPISRLS